MAWRRWMNLAWVGLSLPALAGCTPTTAPTPPTRLPVTRPDDTAQAKKIAARTAKLDADMAAKFRREELVQRRAEEKARRALQAQRDTAEAREAFSRLRADAAGSGAAPPPPPPPSGGLFGPN